jgi:hypothetical protein
MRFVAPLFTLLLITCVASTAPAELNLELMDTVFGRWQAARSVAVQGELAYVALGEDGLAIVDMADPHMMRQINQIDVPGAAMDLLIEDNIIYVASADEGLILYDISNPASPQFITQHAVLETSTTLTKHEDHVFVGYAVEQTHGGVQAINVADIDHIQTVGIIGFNGPTRELTIRYPTLYIAGGSSGLHLVNISVPSEMTLTSSLSVFLDAGSVALHQNYAYVGDRMGWVGIVNISNPQNMIQENSLTSFTGVGSIVKWHEGGDDYLCIADQLSYSVFQLIDPAHPTSIRSFMIEPDVNNFTHLTMFEDTIYLTDGSFGFSRFLMNDPAIPVYDGGYCGMSEIVDVATENGFIFAADQRDGLRIISLENPDSPEEIGGDTRPLNRFLLYEGMGYSVSQNRFWITDYSDPYLPSPRGSVPLLGAGNDIALAGSIACIANNRHGLSVLDISGSAIIQVGSFVLPDSSSANAVEVFDDFALVVCYSGPLYLLDISDPAQISLVDQNESLTSPRDLIRGEDGRAYVAYGGFDADHPEGGLAVFDLSRELGLWRISMLDVERFSVNLVQKNDYIVLANDVDGISTVDISNAAAPRFENGLLTPGDAQSIATTDNLVIVADGDFISIYSSYDTEVVEPATEPVVRTFNLKPAYPNPFNSQTSFSVSVYQPTHLHIAVYDILGREVALLVNESVSAGELSLSFEADSFASGSYLLRGTTTDGSTQNQRITLIR